MLNTLLTKIIGTKFDREMKALQPIVNAINAGEGALQGLSDEELRAGTGRLMERLDNGATLDDVLVDAFALCREAGRRAVNMRPYDVQLVGGMVLHKGRIAEMKTGEGKTLVATLPAYLNALARKGVHVVTVNDYLARRDADWMGRVYRFLGLDVGCIQSEMSPSGPDRQQAYKAHITYGTNNEFGFDYLRDNMKFKLEDKAQRGHFFAIVDEVDSILIDEARTPLIISGPSEDRTEHYYAANSVIPRLKQGEDYEVDEKQRSATLTDAGVEHAQQILGLENLYDPANLEVLHAVSQSLLAHTLYRRDREYVVKDGKVVIVDEFTGRTMQGRRWSDGLHQAVEAKENVRIERESQTYATVTFQNYFRMYEKLSGMTGTADTEAAEFDKIYKLEVTVIPTHRPMVRKDLNDQIYMTEEEKFDAIVNDIATRHENGQPVLVGTTSIEKSETLSRTLTRKGIRHVVLNAKFHEREAEIVAQAGRVGAVTVATNMAGRGTDILLGGNPEALARAEAGVDDPDGTKFAAAFQRFTPLCAEEKQQVIAAGGLHIVGSERHESRRIDNQLRGRSGRQGDPGSSQFYLGLDDDLMRIFGGDRLKGWMDKIGLEKGEAIEHKWVTKQIERAQKQVESRNFEYRKHLLEYDDVMNKQRTTVYGMRDQFLSGETRPWIMEKQGQVLNWILEDTCPPKANPQDWDLERLTKDLKHYFGLELASLAHGIEGINHEQWRGRIQQACDAKLAEKEARLGTDVIRHYERFVALQLLDQQWKDHLLSMDHLKEGISLRAYAQRDPLVEYKNESFRMFEEMIQRVEDDIIRYIFILEPRVQQEEKRIERKEREMVYSAPDKGGPQKKAPVRVKEAKVGPNDPCPCGSGKKYKKCHGGA